MEYAFKYLKSTVLCTSEGYTYAGYQKSCRDSMCSSMNHMPTLSGYTRVTAYSDADLASALYNHGPVSVAVDASSYDFQLYSTGIFGIDSCGTSLDHGVLAVGYGSQNGGDYYIVKNSWGSGWGNNGYINMERKQNSGSSSGCCGILLLNSYPSL